MFIKYLRIYIHKEKMGYGYKMTDILTRKSVIIQDLSLIKEGYEEIEKLNHENKRRANNMKNHTPAPLYAKMSQGVNGTGSPIRLYLNRGEGLQHASVMLEGEQSARMINCVAEVVRAVNSHEALLRALKGLLEVTGKRGDSIWDTARISDAEKAIHQAEGK